VIAALIEVGRLPATKAPKAPKVQPDEKAAEASAAS
jgi:hypothetical protein